MKYCWFFIILTSCTHYNIIIKSYNINNGTVIASYDTGTKEIVLLDKNKYKKIVSDIYKQFFPRHIKDPSFAQSKKFDRIEFKRMCSFMKIKECDNDK